VYFWWYAFNTAFSGTTEQVKTHTKKLIDIVGKGGGFIMGPCSPLDEAKPELLKVWVDYTRNMASIGRIRQILFIRSKNK